MSPCPFLSPDYRYGVTPSTRSPEDPLVGGYRFRLYAMDGDDLGTRTFSEPNWNVGDTVALHDRVYRV